ncbi:MAG: FAD-binding oxidoreductase [Planctomycetes bacterium]|nr:FAD-binding oxidoreductase [Planctomycetota bacterium]
MPLVNDVHSRLNPIEVESIARPNSADDVAGCVRDCIGRGESLAVSGHRHAMGGQQFASGRTLLDMRALSNVVDFDVDRGLLTIGAGADWRRIVVATRSQDASGGPAWAIRQKQTGADELTLGGSVACNAHGRGLAMGPIVEDVESMSLVDGRGELRRCSRDENRELFELAIGGYGLFGVIVDITLRLVPRRKLRRIVRVLDLEDAYAAVERHELDGALYGDFQYAIEPSDDSFLRRGVLACYETVDDSCSVGGDGAGLSRDAWLELLSMAHTAKRRAFETYTRHYLSTHGRIYWSDSMQLSTYVPSYAEFLGATRGAEAVDESLVITELFVPPARVLELMVAARAILRRSRVEDIYGTIRSIRRDSTTFLPWARDDFACVILNLRTEHSPAGVERTRAVARDLIDAAADLGGSFYLTYHRWATRAQLLRCYPRLPVFLARKRALDPNGVFASDWHRHVATLLERDATTLRSGA